MSQKIFHNHSDCRILKSAIYQVRTDESTFDFWQKAIDWNKRQKINK